MWLCMYVCVYKARMCTEYLWENMEDNLNVVVILGRKTGQRAEPFHGVSFASFSFCITCIFLLTQSKIVIQIWFKIQKNRTPPCGGQGTQPPPRPPTGLAPVWLPPTARPPGKHGLPQGAGLPARARQVVRVGGGEGSRLSTARSVPACADPQAISELWYFTCPDTVSYLHR